MLSKLSFPVCLSLCITAVFLLSGCAGHQSSRGEEHVSQREVEIRLDLAEAYLRNNEPRLALQELNRIQPQARNLPRFHFTLGYTRLLLGRGTEAVDAFRRTVELAPDHADAWNNLGLAFLSTNELDAAEQAFTSALAVPTYRTPEVAAINLAQLYLDRDRQTLAQQYVNLALELNWRFTKAYLLAAEIELARGNAERAIALLKQGAEANLDDPRILLTLAEYLILAEQPSQALPWLDRLLETAPDSPEAGTALEYKQSLGEWRGVFMGQMGLVMEQQIKEAAPPLPAEQQPAQDSAVLPKEELPVRPDPEQLAGQSVPEPDPEPAHKPGSPSTLEYDEAWESAYIVQIGAFKDPSRAEKMRDSFKNKTYPAQTTQIVRRGTTWHLVFVAATQNRDQADELAKQFVDKEGKDALVVRIGQGRYLEMTPP